VSEEKRSFRNYIIKSTSILMFIIKTTNCAQKIFGFIIRKYISLYGVNNVRTKNISLVAHLARIESHTS